ncbi:MAG: hypothetical protein WBA88_19880 [Pseudaminobacter sp.]
MYGLKQGILLGLCLALTGGRVAGQTVADSRLSDATAGIELSGEVQRSLEQQQDGKVTPSLLNSRPPTITVSRNNQGEGSAHFSYGVYTGTFRRVTNPYSGNAYWTLYEGVYEEATGVKYTGRFHYFHDNSGKHSYIEEGWKLADRGRYIFVGGRAAPGGLSKSGVYSVQASQRAMPAFTPADKGYVAGFEKRYASQVKKFRQMQAAESGGGLLSFGQILALGLGAGVLSQANMSGADAATIGSAFVADVLTDGKAGALRSVTETPRAPAQYHPAVTQANAAKTATAAANSESVTVSCPSGASSTIPIRYKTQSCRSAMIEFARVYSCNLIDDFAAVGQRCKSACGHPQCLQ